MVEDSDAERVNWSEILNGTYAPALVLVSLGVWLHAADSLIVATMLPSIVRDIGGEALVAWTVALYEIGSVVTGAAGGLLALRFGVRAPMAATALIFAAGCLISAVSGSMPILLIGRLLQGIGGGGLMALSFIAVSVLFPKRLIARAMGAIATLWGVSAFLGPLIGGFFVEYATWRIGFFAFAAQALLLAAWIAFGLKIGARPDRSGTSEHPPIARLVILSAGVVMIAYGGIDIALFRTAAFVLAGVACLIVFLVFDGRQSRTRLLPTAPFDLRAPQGAALVMILVFSAGTIAITAYGPLLVTIIHDASALTAGYIVACSSIGWTVAAILVSGAPERRDPQLIGLGMAIVTASILGFMWSVPNGPVWLIAICAAMEGGGFGMAWTFILRRVTALTAPGEMERVSGAIPTVQRLGYALGAAYIGIVANAAGFPSAQTGSEFETAARWIFIGCLPLAGLGIVATISFIRPAKRKHQGQKS